MKYLLSYIWAILWALIICILLLLPSNNFNEISIPIFNGIDKMVHLGIFFVEAVLIYYGAIHRKKRKANKWITVVKVIIVTAIFAVLTELAQMYFTNTRSGDPWDVFADVAGVGMATFAFLLLYKEEK